VLTNHELDRNIEDLTDTEIYPAIRYLEADPRIEDKQDADDQDKHNGVTICVCFIHSTVRVPGLLVALLELMHVLVKPENEIDG
jgi:hypothetical protein